MPRDRAAIRIRGNSQWLWQVKKAPAVHLCARVVWASGLHVRVAYPCADQSTWDRDIFLEWWEPRPEWQSEAQWQALWDAETPGPRRAASA